MNTTKLTGYHFNLVEMQLDFDACALRKEQSKTGYNLKLRQRAPQTPPWGGRGRRDVTAGTLFNTSRRRHAVRVQPSGRHRRHSPTLFQQCSVTPQPALECARRVWRRAALPACPSCLTPAENKRGFGLQDLVMGNKL